MVDCADRISREQTTGVAATLVDWVSEDDELHLLPSTAPELGSRYTTLGELGRGGMSVVLRVRDARLNRVVAMKILGDAVSTARSIQRFLAEAHEFRVGNHGFTIPIHGPQGQFAMFTISKACRDEDWDRLIPEISRDMLLLSHYIHRQVMDSTGASDATERTQKLSPRERDVLTMISAGRRRAQIADALGISESTLRVYIDSARHKLGALNSFHAVALAVKTGAIKV